MLYKEVAPVDFLALRVFVSLEPFAYHIFLSVGQSGGHGQIVSPFVGIGVSTTSTNELAILVECEYLLRSESPVNIRIDCTKLLLEDSLILLLLTNRGIVIVRTTSHG